MYKAFLLFFAIDYKKILLDKGLALQTTRRRLWLQFQRRFFSSVFAHLWLFVCTSYVYGH